MAFHNQNIFKTITKSVCLYPNTDDQKHDCRYDS
ncbi:hypothetical protein BH23BAC1_BH23BAC1_50940 [soil metagenome]